MTTIKINVETNFASLLNQEAQSRQLSLEQLAKAWLEERLEDAKSESAVPLSPDEILGIERGLADVEAGRTHTHADVLVDLAKWRDE
jgi:predicted transcriptional regulator